MRLTFWGAAQTVTGSMHLLEFEGGRVLMDCGLYQGRRADAKRFNQEFPADPSSIDVVLLSHAHIDHSGLLPKLYREGFGGSVFATPATRDLCESMLADSAHIQEKDAAWVNRREKRHGDDEVEPLYTSEDVDGVLRAFITVGYGETFRPLPGLEVEYRDAGHILGSASMMLTVEEDGRTVKIGFTGDVGREQRPILRDPQPMSDCDYLICESTYGGRVHEPTDRAKDRLANVVGATARRGGKVIIPAFAVGRTQEIVYRLDELTNENRLPAIPVYVDSPLAVNVTDIYRRHPECYDQELIRYMEADAEPFGFARLTYVRDVEESKRLNVSSLPMVVISASGMCEAGRVLHHLRHTIEDPKNTIMIVGYCAEHTLGRRIVERRREVKIFGEPHRLRAEVEVMNAYSAHADEPELVRFVGHLDRKRLKKIFLVHGDPVRQLALFDALRANGYENAHGPSRGESFEL
ncbi:MAG: MBL fold metallo-hydrolase [Gemmatimonadetes bacterium]|nr:MBL fold metallo-hydrolase [Gemmatimonadota bacterium]MDA1102723.1 MBL fold metallo-hydrolase [Gemmatimonadota bacterium]